MISLWVFHLQLPLFVHTLLRFLSFLIENLLTIEINPKLVLLELLRIKLQYPPQHNPSPLLLPQPLLPDKSNKQHQHRIRIQPPIVSLIEPLLRQLFLDDDCHGLQGRDLPEPFFSLSS